jgi:hypothetical protein
MLIEPHGPSPRPSPVPRAGGGGAERGLSFLRCPSRPSPVACAEVLGHAAGVSPRLLPNAAKAAKILPDRDLPALHQYLALLVVESPRFLPTPVESPLPPPLAGRAAPLAVAARRGLWLLDREVAETPWADYTRRS